ncbi:MAG: hypothetical protein ACD_75C02166G0001, partial [uncultured bacterium]
MWRDGYLLHLQIQVLTSRGYFNKINDVWPQYGLGHPGAADKVWRDHLVGASPLEFYIRPFFTGTGQDVKVRIQAPSSKSNIDIRCVRGDYRD